MASRRLAASRSFAASPGLFDADEVVSTDRLRLSSLAEDDIDRLAWLAAPLAPEWTLDDLSNAVEAGRGALIAEATGEAIGIAVAILDRPEASAACVPFVSINPSRRFRGLGGEAALALERHLRHRFGIEKVYAPIPDGRGLAVYFWLRLGYRPLTGSEAPGPLVGLTPESKAGIWMLREGM